MNMLNNKRQCTDAGFTLAEVLVSLAIISILLAALTGVFERSGRLYTSQNATAALQQEVRAALDVIASEVRMAAYNPTKADNSSTNKKFSIKKASATEFRFTTDLDGDGKLGNPTSKKPYNDDGECEARSFRLSLGTQSIRMGCGDGTTYVKDWETLIGATDNLKVTLLDFGYLDKDNNPTTLRSEIRSTVITITAEAPAGRAGMLQRTYTTTVDIRNAGLDGA